MSKEKEEISNREAIERWANYILPVAFMTEKLTIPDTGEM